RILGDEGIQILVRAETVNVKGRSGEEVGLTVRTPSGEQKIEGSDILAAAGRVPNTAGIGLEEAGVELDGRGYIRVNERLETATTDETQGFMKVLLGASDDRILGFTMIGAEAGEVMTVVQTAMLAGLPYPKLRDAVIAHPTMAEGLGPLFSNVPPLSAN